MVWLNSDYRLRDHEHESDENDFDLSEARRASLSPPIAGNIRAIKTSVLACDFFLKSNSERDDEKSRKILERIVFRDNNFSKFVWFLLENLIYRFSLFEFVITREEGYKGVRIQYRDPLSLKFEYDDKARLTQIKQMLRSGQEVKIDIRRVLIFEDLDNKMGSLIPIAQKREALSQSLYDYLQRYSSPCVFVHSSEHVTQKELDNLVRSFRTNTSTAHNPAFVLPREFSLASHQGLGFDPNPLITAIKEIDTGVSDIFLSSFLKAVESGSGSFAMVMGLEDFYYNTLKGVVTQVKDDFNRHLLPLISKINGIPDDAYSLSSFDILNKPGKAKADIIINFVKNGVVELTPELKNYVIELYKLPKSISSEAETVKDNGKGEEEEEEDIDQAKEVEEEQDAKKERVDMSLSGSLRPLHGAGIRGEEIEARHEEAKGKVGKSDDIATGSCCQEKNDRIDLDKKEIKSLLPYQLILIKNENLLNDLFKRSFSSMLKEHLSQFKKGGKVLRWKRASFERKLKKETLGISRILTQDIIDYYYQDRARKRELKLDITPNIDPETVPVLEKLRRMRLALKAEKKNRNLINEIIYYLIINEEAISGLSFSRRGTNNRRIVKQFLERIEAVEKGDKFKTAVADTVSFVSQNTTEVTLDRLKPVAYVFRNGDPVSKVCKRLNGSILNQLDIERWSPPLHHNCKSFLDPIYSDTVAEIQFDKVTLTADELKSMTL